MEKQLVQRAQKGDEAAFEKIVTTYEARVFALALRFTGSPADAADLTQEVFLRAWRSLATFRGDSTLSTWLYRITNNLCLDHARRHTQVATMPLEEEDTGEGRLPEMRAASIPEEALEQGEVQREIAAALEKLSDEHRQMICLRDMDGYTYAEIAEALNLEEGTVKSRLARARSKMREILLARGNISLPSASKGQGRRQNHV